MTEEYEEPKELDLLMALYLVVFYLQGGDNHNEFLADPPPQSRNRRGWQSKETFVDLSSYLKPSFEILNALETEAWIEQPKKFKKWKEQTCIKVTKKGMQKGRDLLTSIMLDGVNDALEVRKYHEEYINYKTRTDLFREQDGFDSDEENDNYLENIDL
jgi:hypothetical protein